MSWYERGSTAAVSPGVHGGTSRTPTGDPIPKGLSSPANGCDISTAPPACGSAPDPTKLMDLREDEKKEFTLVPGIPGVGEVVTRPFGKSNLPTQ